MTKKNIQFVELTGIVLDILEKGVTEYEKKHGAQVFNRSRLQSI